MKRFLFSAGTAIMISLLLPDHAFAICQTCNNNNTLNAMCWTISACDSGATMSACVVKDVIDPKTGVVTSRYCDSVNTTQGPECNGADPSCSSGTGTTGSGSTSGGSDCVINTGDVCPAQCGGCTVLNLACC